MVMIKVSFADSQKLLFTLCHVIVFMRPFQFINSTSQFTVLDRFSNRSDTFEKKIEQCKQSRLNVVQAKFHFHIIH